MASPFLPSAKQPGVLPVHKEAVAGLTLHTWVSGGRSCLQVVCGREARPLAGLLHWGRREPVAEPVPSAQALGFRRQTLPPVSYCCC